MTFDVPWCPACSHYLTPTSMRADGTCPFCAQVVDYKRNAKAIDALARGVEPHTEDDVPVPWHLKLLLAAAAIYLGWRAVQGADWLFSLFGVTGR